MEMTIGNRKLQGVGLVEVTSHLGGAKEDTPANRAALRQDALVLTDTATGKTYYAHKQGMNNDGVLAGRDARVQVDGKDYVVERPVNMPDTAGEKALDTLSGFMTRMSDDAGLLALRAQVALMNLRMAWASR